MNTENPIHHYETHLQRLQEIVQKMENGELSLEASLKEYERGIALIRQCQQALNEAEQKVQILMQQSAASDTDGSEANLVPFDQDQGQNPDNDQDHGND